MNAPDVNYRSYADVDGLILADLRVDPANDGLRAADFADVLKFSHASNVTARRLVVVGGTENAVDMNRMCRDIVLEDCTLQGGDQAGAVIKGGSSNITLRRVEYTAVKGFCEVLIGDWSDQSYDKTTGVRLIENTRRDGEAVRVIVGRADWPGIVGGNVKVLRLQSYALKAYWWAKYFWVRILLRKKPLVAHL